MTTFDEAGFLSTDVDEAAEAIRAKFPVHVRLLSDVSVAANRLLSAVVLDSLNVRHLVAAISFERIVGTVEGATLLLKRGMVPQAQVLGRSAVEGWFILGAVAKDHEFANRFVLSEDHHQLAGLKRLHRNLELRGALQSEIEESKARLDELAGKLKASGHRAFTTQNIAQIAGLDSIYNSVFSFFSMALHVTSRSLDQAILLDSDQSICIERGPTEHHLALTAEMLSQSVIHGIELMGEVFDDLPDVGVTALSCRLDEAIQRRQDEGDGHR